MSCDKKKAHVSLGESGKRILVFISIYDFTEITRWIFIVLERKKKLACAPIGEMWKS